MQLLASRRDENSGVMFCEFDDEQNHELVARQNFRKKILAEAESRPDHQKNYSTKWGIFLCFHDWGTNKEVFEKVFPQLAYSLDTLCFIYILK